ncbi:CHAD domain-containing protein [Mucilaginibacter sp.]
MKKKKEVKYLNKHWQKLQCGLKAFAKTNDAEQLHQFRVEVKKVKSFLQLMEGTAHLHLLKTFKPVRKVFKRAGQIRDAQIHLQLADKYNLNNEAFTTAERRKMEKSTALFVTNTSTYLNKLKRTHRRIKSKLHPVAGKSIAKFYKSELVTVGKSLTTPHFDDGLHNCRKHLKTLMYNRKLVGNALNNIPFNNEYIDQLQSQIGEWHDHVLAIDLFSSPNLEVKPVVAQLKQDNREMEKSITETATSFMDKVAEPSKDKGKHGRRN